MNLLEIIPTLPSSLTHGIYMLYTFILQKSVRPGGDEECELMQGSNYNDNDIQLYQPNETDTHQTNTMPNVRNTLLMLRML